MKTKNILFAKLLVKSGIVIIFCLFAVATPTQASPVGLSLDPPLVRVQIKPGKSITKSFTIENIENTDKYLVVRVIPFNKADNNGNPTIDIKASASWLKYFNLSNSEIKFDEPFLLKAKNKQQIVVSLSVPETANAEDLYTTLLFSTYDNSISGDQKNISIGSSIGANLLISITPEINPNTILKIEKITITSGSFVKIGRRYYADNLTPITVTAIATNEGPSLTETKGTFKLTNKKNSEVLFLQGILPQYVISKSSRTLISSNEKPFFFSPTLRIVGLHTLSFNVKSENTNTSNSIDIFFFPFKSGATIFISFVLLKIISKVTNKNQVVDN